MNTENESESNHKAFLQARLKGILKQIEQSGFDRLLTITYRDGEPLKVALARQISAEEQAEERPFSDDKVRKKCREALVKARKMGENETLEMWSVGGYEPTRR